MANALGATGAVSNSVYIPIQPLATAGLNERYLFSRTKTEGEFFKLNPWPRDKPFTAVDRIYAVLTDSVLKENSSPMEKKTYEILRDVESIYAIQGTIQPQDWELILEGLDEKLDEIRELAPANIAPLMNKCLLLLSLLDAQGVVTLNLQIRTFLKNRLDGGELEASPGFMRTEEIENQSRKEKEESGCFSFSTIAKVAMAVLVILGISAYGAHNASEAGFFQRPPVPGPTPNPQVPAQILNSVGRVCQNPPSTINHSWMNIVNCVLDENCITRMNNRKVDFAAIRCSDDQYSSYLYEAAKNNASNLVLDTLFESGPSCWTADDIFYGTRFLFGFERYDTLEKAINNKNLHAGMMTSQNLETLWHAVSKDKDEKALEILKKMGCHWPFLAEFSNAQTLDDTLIEQVVKDPNLIQELINHKVDLLKTGADGYPLLAKYAMHVSKPDLKTFQLLRENAQWPPAAIYGTVWKMLEYGRYDLLESAIQSRTIVPADLDETAKAQLWKHFQQQDHSEKTLPLLIELGCSQEPLAPEISITLVENGQPSSPIVQEESQAAGEPKAREITIALVEDPQPSSPIVQKEAQVADSEYAQSGQEAVREEAVNIDENPIV